MYRPQDATLRRLDREVRTHLSRNAWKIGASVHHASDFTIAHSNMVFSVTCVAATTSAYSNLSKLIEEMDQQTRFFRTADRPHPIFFTDFALSGQTLAECAKRKITVLTLNSIGLLENLPLSLTRPVPQISDAQQLLMLQSQWKVCLEISNGFRNVGKILQAIEWATLGLSSGRGLRFVYLRLTDLYLSDNNLVEAENSCRTAIQCFPQDQAIIRQMIKVLTIKGDINEVANLRRRLDELVAENGAPSVLANPSNGFNKTACGSIPSKNANDTVSKTKSLFWPFKKR